MSPETALFNALKAIEAAANSEANNILSGTDVHPTKHSPITKPKTIRVGNCISDFAPVGENYKEFDADIVIEILFKVEDSNNPNSYAEATDSVCEMTKEVAKGLKAKGLLGEYCNNYQLLTGLRSFTNIETGDHAIARLPIRINPTGQK